MTFFMNTIMKDNKIRSYDDQDTRYNFHIADSNEYNYQIHPQNVILNCSDVTDDMRIFNYKCEPIKTNTSNTFERAKNFKKQNQNTIIDITQISHVHNPELTIDRSPDMSRENFLDCGANPETSQTESYLCISVLCSLMILFILFSMKYKI